MVKTTADDDLAIWEVNASTVTVLTIDFPATVTAGLTWPYIMDKNTFQYFCQRQMILWASVLCNGHIR